MSDLSTQSLLKAFEKAGYTLTDPVPDSKGSGAFLHKLSSTEQSPVRVLCALSGGLDSMVLLHLLKHSGLQVRGIHVDHAAHSDSAAWADWVSVRAQAMDVAVVVHRLTDTPSGGSLEEFWRNARRTLFIDELQDDEMLVTAHHQDDQLETLLLQLFRGAGPTGLQSMPLHQRLPNAQLHVRPLLEHSREHLDAYAREHGIEFLEDPSNADMRFDRNFLRHTILPKLKERWPSVGHVVARSTELIAESVKLNDALAAQDASICDQDESLDWEALQALDRARQANAVRYWLQRLNARMPNRRRLAEALRQWNEATADRLPVLKLDGGAVQKYRSRLVYQSSQIEVSDKWTGTLKMGQWLALPGIDSSLGLMDGSQCSAAVLANGSAGPAIQRAKLASTILRVRYRKNGEKLRRAAGHHQKLKHWFQQNDVPPVRRSRLPLIFLDTELIAIANIWVDARFRLDPHSGPEQKTCHLIWRVLPGENAK